MSGFNKLSSRLTLRADADNTIIDTGQTADEIDPLNIPKVKEAYDALTKLDGLDLWYTIVTRELEATCHLHGDGASSHAHNLDKNRILRPEKSGKTSSAPSGRGSTLALSMQYERMKKENMKMRNDKGLPADQVDDVGIFYRKSLARAIREQVSYELENLPLSDLLLTFDCLQICKGQLFIRSKRIPGGCRALHASDGLRCRGTRLPSQSSGLSGQISTIRRSRKGLQYGHRA